MADEIKSDLYFLYEADPLMSGQNEAFAFKDNYVVLYDVFARRSFGSFHMLQGGYTGSDARDYMNRMIGEVFHMFKVRPGLTSSQKTEMKSILHECVSEEGWFENVLAKMENRGFLNREQKERAIANRWSSANVPYNRSPFSN